MKIIIYTIYLMSFYLISYAEETLSCGKYMFQVDSVKNIKNTDIMIFSTKPLAENTNDVKLVVSGNLPGANGQTKTFCRYIPYLNSVDVLNASPSFDPSSGVVSITVAASEIEEMGEDGQPEYKFHTQEFLIYLKINIQAESEDKFVGFGVGPK